MRKRNWVAIATWRMALEGFVQHEAAIRDGKRASEFIPDLVQAVEDYPFYKSVGYGGLPNENGVVQLDAAFMDGDTLAFGAIAGIEDFANPIRIAKQLSVERYNSFLVGEGAMEYARNAGFAQKPMLTERAEKLWQIRKRDIVEKGLAPYDGHDTVCIMAQDQEGSIVAGTSTSGLFMKKAGRVGDSPISGSGLYADSEAGAAAATGLGEDIMKTCVSFQTVLFMQAGMTAQDAVDKAVSQATAQLVRHRGVAGDISVVCVDKDGNFGAATNTDEFSYVVMGEDMRPTVYLTDKHGEHRLADEAWMQAYYDERHKKIED
ncbi:isoaspartyl peptidase/L-asparaginase [Culicoidibacter larvae]|uniref:N(4)-(Beta-N-acetylglucosaminyl)-L-asparaginase n=1 Tax=Culicoidibacter larvae TaxID=2579976 RepID=A0A5R8QH13_9FIRM|nr:isoaspartyl peptidase/L-asparaginase [Culicoidibacter larvae]TLG77319.1 N(4)-(beta-N-acetylglucosaminyl)-L-asparaginase [Culicoidibacter larvae]